MILCSLFDRLKAALHLNNLQKKKSSHNRTLCDALSSFSGQFNVHYAGISCFTHLPCLKL